MPSLAGSLSGHRGLEWGVRRQRIARRVFPGPEIDPSLVLVCFTSKQAEQQSKQLLPFNQNANTEREGLLLLNY